jgi:Golgi SNAP receptor complex protein 1
MRRSSNLFSLGRTSSIRRNIQELIIIFNMSTWENSRKHARALEARLETKLTAYSKLAAQISAGSPRPSTDKLSEQEEGIGGYKLMEEEIDELLEKVSSFFQNSLSDNANHDEQLSGAIDALTALLNSPDIPPSTSMMHAASRHRDVLDDYRRDFVRTRVSLAIAISSRS